MQSETLKPCPVCGDEPKWRGSRHDYAAGIYRLQCLGETHLFQAYGASEEKCIAAWNNRAPTQPADSAGLVERLNRNAGWRNAQWQCITDPALLTEAAHHIAAQDAEVARLREALGEAREEALWCAYHAGHVKDGRWTHMFMSDGEGLAADCGFDPRQADYDDAAIRAAIPVAARAALNPETGHD